MLITLAIANKFKLANHFTDETAIYVSSLKLDSISTKKGNAIDTISFTLENAVLDSIDESFLYVCYETIVDVYIDSNLIIAGYIDTLTSTSDNKINFGISSVMKWQYQQFLAPALAGSCQNQVYSTNCKLNADSFNYQFTTVKINCFTGKVALTITEPNIILGDNVSSTGNSLFLDRQNWWNAIVIINGIYRTTVTNVTDDAIYLGINFLDIKLTTVSLTVYLKCDKTYGQCYSRFNNTKNFWGFANTGNQVQTIDIFSGSNLTFCGIELQEQDLIACDIDFSIYGVDLR